VLSRRAWLRLIGGFVAAFAAGVIVAIAVKRAGGWQAGTGWDRTVLKHSHPALPRWADTILLLVPWLGTNITYFALLIPFSVWLRRIHRSEIAAELWVAVIGNYLLNLVTKAAFGRPRPALWTRRGEYTWTAYPSGHAIAMISVLLFGAWILHRERGRIWAYIVWLPLFAATCYSRLYLGVHWPTDLVGGIAIGVVWLATLWLTFRRDDWRVAHG